MLGRTVLTHLLGDLEDCQLEGPRAKEGSVMIHNGGWDPLPLSRTSGL